MREGFDLIKRKHKRLAVIYSVAGGICSGLAIAGILLLIFKLCGAELGWYIYLAAGIAVAALAAVAIYFAVRPTDKKLARKLDSAYSLDEKAGTMIEFEGQEGEMLAMQRADADAALKSLPKRRPSVLSIALKPLAVIVAAALLVVGIVIPGNYKTVDNTVVAEPPYEVSETVLTKLKSLISDVQGDTTLNEGVQAAYLETLNGLYDSITAEDITEDSVKSDARNAMYDISYTSMNTNTYDNIAKILTKNSTTNADTDVFGSALRSSAKVYAEYYTTFTSYSNLAAAYSNFRNKIYTYMEAASTSFAAAVSGITEITVPSDYAYILDLAITDESLADFYTELTSYITYGNQRRTYTSGDDLYDALYDFYRVVNYNVTRYASGNMELKDEDGNGVISNITSAAEDFSQSATTAMLVQSYTFMADVYVRQTLASIFGIAAVGYTIDDGSDTEGDSDDPSGDGSGGGTGELITESEYIYDPSTGEYVLYTQLLSELYEMLEDDSISDETREYISQYINNLIATNG